MTFFQSIITFLQDGGSFIYPIALVLVIGLAITIERWLYLSTTLNANKKAMKLIQPYLKSGDVQEIFGITKLSKAPVADILHSGVSRLTHTNRREDIENAMEDVLMEHMLRLEKRTPFLATLANIATLLGLLGTVIGMIEAFATLASAGSDINPSLLAGGIWKALLTTAAGLVVAIPALFAWHLFDRRIERHIAIMNKYIVNFKLK